MTLDAQSTMEMKLINANRLSRKQYKELIQSLGGKFSFFQRIKMGGTGIGGLILKPNENPDLPLKYGKATETVKVSIEWLKKGLLIGLNNTKEVKLIAFPTPTVDWEPLESIQTEGGLKKESRIKLRIDSKELFIYTSGWNNKDVYNYMNKLSGAF
jgi:hypothetical protein